MKNASATPLEGAGIEDLDPDEISLVELGGDVGAQLDALGFFLFGDHPMKNVPSGEVAHRALDRGPKV